MLLAILFAILLPVQFPARFFDAIRHSQHGQIDIRTRADALLRRCSRWLSVPDGDLQRFSKFKISTIVARLENVAKSDAAELKQEVSTVVTDLKSHL